MAPGQRDVVFPCILAARYQLTARIAGGGMAQVFRAYDLHLDRQVAVKIIAGELRADSEFDARFRREAQIVSKLNDPHIVVVHDFGIDVDYGPFLVMELLQGETLRERLNKSGPLAVPAALQLGEQVMLALTHAHGMGVIHRDLKPDNVFLLAQGGVKLHIRILDFGIAQMIQGDRPQEGDFTTKAGQTVGTPRYMAPEQSSGRKATEQSDLYSAAVVLFEALTGNVPEVIGPRLRQRCADAPVGLERLIEQCLSSNPDDRPVSAAEAYLHLHEMARSYRGELLVSETAVAQLTARFKHPHLPLRGSSRRRWLYTAAGGLVLSPFVWWLWPRSHPHPQHESIFGLGIGFHRDDLVSRFGKPAPAPDDAVNDPLIPRSENEVQLSYWAEHLLTVGLRNDRVVFVVARESGTATGRDIRIGDSERELHRAYPERPASIQVIDADRTSRHWGRIFHYPQLSLSIEVRDGVVTGLALR